MTPALKLLRGISLLFTLVFSAASFSGEAGPSGQFIDIGPQTAAEIQLVLDTLDASLETSAESLPVIVMMLHGAEAHRFLRRNYQANKAMIDQTAKLAEAKVIKVQICATWLAENGYDTSELYPFTSTVPFGAGELERLAREEGYTEFSVNI